MGLTTDLTILNLSDQEEAECGISVIDSHGAPLLAVPFLHVPAAAAAPSTDLFSAQDDPTAAVQDAWGAVACEKEGFTACAAVYRNGGRDVEYILPSARMN